MILTRFTDNGSRFKVRSSTHEAKHHLHGKIFDFCDHPIRVNHSFGSQYCRPSQPNHHKRLNNPPANAFDVQVAARPVHTVAKSFTGAPYGPGNNALLAKQSASVPGVNDVLSHMHQSSSADETSQEGTSMLQSAPLPGQGGTTQPAPKNGEDSVTSWVTDSGSDKPMDDACDAAMLEQSGEDLIHDSKNLGDDERAVDIPNSGIVHDDAADEQEEQTTSQLSSRTITPSPMPRDQASRSTFVSPTNNASDQSIGGQDNQPSGAKHRTLDYGTVRRYLNKRSVDHQPIPMDWAVHPSSISGDTRQATRRVDISPSGAHNSTYASQSVSSQSITSQSTPHKKKNGKGKSKAKQSQQKLREQSSSYVLPATFYQPQPADAAISQQLPSQPWNASRNTAGAALNPQGFDLHNEHSGSPRVKVSQGHHGSGPTKHLPGPQQEHHQSARHSPSYLEPMAEKLLGYSTFGLTPPRSSETMSYTSPTTEPFPPFNDHDYENLTPRLSGNSPRAYEDATDTVDNNGKKKSHALNPAAMEFVSPVRTSTAKPEILTAEPHGTISKPGSPAMAINNQSDDGSEAKGGDKKEDQSAIKDFASPKKSQKSTADSSIPAGNTGHTEERNNSTKKPLNSWAKHKQNKKAKSHASQGNQTTDNDHGEQAQKGSGNKTQSSSEDKPASHVDDEADKQQRDNSQDQKQDHSGNKDVVPKKTTTKGKSATKDVSAKLPVVPGATWVETDPKKTSKKKNANRHASKGKTAVKSAGSSVTSAPTFSQESEVKGEQDSGSRATNWRGNSESMSKGNHKAEAETQDGLERAATPAPTGTAAEAKKREHPATQPNEVGQKTSKESATKNQKETEVSSSTQTKKSKGKKQKSSAANQKAASQDEDQATPFAATPAVTTDKAEVERRDTMVSLSQADLASILDESDKAALSSSGTKTPSLRDAPAPNNSPWRKDGKSKTSDKTKEESNDGHPETLLEGEERKGG